MINKNITLFQNIINNNKKQLINIYQVIFRFKTINWKEIKNN